MAGIAEGAAKAGLEINSRENRNRSIWKAVSTSLASKGSTALLQLGSLPIAARVLGREEFGIFATVSSALFAVAMLQLGVGPALAKKISDAAATRDRKLQALYYQTGALLLGVLILLGAAISSLFLLSLPITTLFGDAFRPWAGEMRQALWIGLFLMTGQLLVAHTDRVREGFMEAASVNASSALGNLASAVLVAAGISFYPSVSFLLLAIYLPNILSRMVNTFFLLRKRPYLLQNPNLPGKSLALLLLRDGVSFSATSFLVYVIEFSLCAYFVARTMGPGEVAVFHALMTISTAYIGLLTMVGTPIWAALSDANKNGDLEWIKSAVAKYRKYLFCLAGGLGCLLVLLGPNLLPLWYGDEFTATRTVFLTHSLFLLVMGWRLIHRTLAIGMDQIRTSVQPILIGLGLEIVLGVAGLSLFGLPGLFLGMAGGILLYPAWRLPAVIKAKF